MARQVSACHAEALGVGGLGVFLLVELTVADPISSIHGWIKIPVRYPCYPRNPWLQFLSREIRVNLKLVPLPRRSALPFAPLPSVSEIPFSRLCPFVVTAIETDLNANSRGQIFRGAHAPSRAGFGASPKRTFLHALAL